MTANATGRSASRAQVPVLDPAAVDRLRQAVVNVVRAARAIFDVLRRALAALVPALARFARTVKPILDARRAGLRRMHTAYSRRQRARRSRR